MTVIFLRYEIEKRLRAVYEMTATHHGRRALGHDGRSRPAQHLGVVVTAVHLLPSPPSLLPWMPSPPPLGHPCMLVPAAPLLLGQSLARMSLPVPEHGSQ